MGEFTAPIGIFAFVIVVGFLFLYTQARQRAKDFKKTKLIFSSLSHSLVQLREHVEEEAEHWPIFARPLMFTEIDHDAQVEFAKAHQAITDADEIIPQIANSEEPETPEYFHPSYLFKVFENLNTISIGNQITKNIRLLERRIGIIESSFKSIRSERYKAEKKRREVRRAIRRLRSRIEYTNKKLKVMDTWNSIESHNFSWVVNVADNCHLTAHAQVIKHPDEEQGYLEHAVADVFAEVGNFALDCVDLFVESQKVPRRYELDEFTQLFNESKDFLESIITMDSNWNGWRKLQRAKSHIDKFPTKKLLAENSLRHFNHQQIVLERLISLINKLQITKDIEFVTQLEKECTYYWYSYEERRKEWEKVLGIPPKFPSAELNQFQTLLVTSILPPIAADMFIKQSMIPILIKNLNDAIQKYNFIRSLTSRLESELEYHKNAQETVNSLLNSQGKATKILAKIKIVLQDTSPDLIDEGEILINEHQNFVERANRVRGANFPELEANLAIFLLSSENLINKHTIEITKLIEDYTIFYKKIEGSLEELSKYINHSPHFDAQTIKILSGAHNAGWKLTQEKATEKYSWLRNATNQMNTWIKNIDPFIKKTREKHEAFLIGKNQVENQLRKAKQELQLQRTHIERKWGWYQNELLPSLNHAEQQLDTEINEWERLIERNWAELSIHKGIARCEQLIKFSEEILRTLNDQIRKTMQKQSMLTSKVNDINNLTATNTRRLSLEEQQEIRKLVNLARQAQHFNTAEEYLGYALSLALKKVDWKMQKAINNIININSEGGPVFMERVNNSHGNVHGRKDKHGK